MPCTRDGSAGYRRRPGGEVKAAGAPRGRATHVSLTRNTASLDDRDAVHAWLGLASSRICSNLPGTTNALRGASFAVTSREGRPSEGEQSMKIVVIGGTG